MTRLPHGRQRYGRPRRRTRFVVPHDRDVVGNAKAGWRICCQAEGSDRWHRTRRSGAATRAGHDARAASRPSLIVGPRFRQRQAWRGRAPRSRALGEPRRVGRRPDRSPAGHRRTPGVRVLDRQGETRPTRRRRRRPRRPNTARPAPHRGPRARPVFRVGVAGAAARSWGSPGHQDAAKALLLEPVQDRLAGGRRCPLSTGRPRCRACGRVLDAARHIGEERIRRVEADVGDAVVRPARNARADSLRTNPSWSIAAEPLLESRR